MTYPINTVYKCLGPRFRGNDKLGYLFVKTSLISIHNLKIGQFE